jgi:hypothetical protein
LSLNHRTWIVLVLVAAMLQGCGFGISSFSLGGSSTGTNLAEEEATGSDADRPTNVSITKSNPLEAYIAVGGTIKRCWFNATDPLLPNHVYRADVSPGGGTVKITVHQRARLGRAGLTTYIIDFKQSGPSTVITTLNRKMPPEFAAKMQYDINRWRGGQSNCNKTMPTA